MDDRVKLGFDYAKEIATQLITLSTAFLALTITFTKEFLAANPTGGRGWLTAAWILHCIAICCGVWSLLALTGTLMPLTPDHRLLRELTLASNVRTPAFLQIVSFAIGTIVMVVYAVVSLRKRR